MHSKLTPKLIFKAGKLVIFKGSKAFFLTEIEKYDQKWVKIECKRTQVVFWEVMRRIVAAKLSNKTFAREASKQLPLYHSLYYNKNCKIEKK